MSEIAEILRTTAHRPRPLPERPWIMEQTWNDLLFAHWPVSAARLRELVPRPLELDLYDDQAWLAVTPFHMSGVRARGLPPIPGTSAFPELNVRTYVSFRDKSGDIFPGVYFFSLDAASRLAVMGARLSYGLPYFFARMQVAVSGDRVRYGSTRARGPAVLRAEYRAIAPPRESMPGRLEHFLTERYCLYVVEHGQVSRAQIHHVPWPLQTAEAMFPENSMAAAAGITLPGVQPLLHFAKRLRVLVWGPEKL